MEPLPIPGTLVSLGARWIKSEPDFTFVNHPRCDCGKERARGSSYLLGCFSLVHLLVPSALLPKAAFTQLCPGRSVWDDPRRTRAGTLASVILVVLSDDPPHTVELSSVAPPPPPPLDLTPAFLLQGSVAPRHIRFLSRRFGFAAVIQHFAVWIFFLFVCFLSLFICVYSLHFTAALVRRREGNGVAGMGGLTMHYGTECSCGCAEKRRAQRHLSGCF